MTFKELIEQRGIKQTFIARKIGVSNSTVTAWVKGISTPDLATIDKVAKLFGISSGDAAEIFLASRLSNRKDGNAEMKGEARNAVAG